MDMLLPAFLPDEIQPFSGIKCILDYFGGKGEFEFVLSICEVRSAKVGKVHASVIQSKQHNPLSKF